MWQQIVHRWCAGRFVIDVQFATTLDAAAADAADAEITQDGQ